MSVLEGSATDIVLLNSFIVNKKRCKVYLHRWTLIWETEKTPRVQCTVPLQDVITIHYNWPPTDNSEDSKADPCSFVLHFAKHHFNNIWRHQKVTIRHDDGRQIASWVTTIRNHLNTFVHRPKKLLLFVNPYGGKKKALKIFEKYGKPLFKLANVDVNVILTQRQNQIADILLQQSLDNYDAVACVGGDGTFSEVFNGLIMKTCKDKNIDLNNSEIEIPTPSISVGVIPAGSTDTISYCIHGTNDIETSVLHIIFGETIGLDVSSVSSKEKLHCFYASVLSYGYLGDVAKDSEKFRWMGPKRYEYSGFKKILSNSGYEGEIVLMPDVSDPNDGNKCLENCDRCKSKCRDKKNYLSGENTDWTVVRGKFFMVNGANITCACARSPNGLAPYCHLGDGCIDLVLIRHTSLLNNLRLLLRLTSRDKTINDLPFVEVYRTKEFKFRSIDNTSRRAFSSVWNCDGEIIDNTDVTVRVHCQLLNVFSRGLKVNLPEPSCFCSL